MYLHNKNSLQYKKLSNIFLNNKMANNFLTRAVLKCECKGYDVRTIDIATPVNAKLSGFYKRSFAYVTIKNRWPKILNDMIGILVDEKDVIGDEFGRKAKEELKCLLEKVWELKCEVENDKPLRAIKSNYSYVKYFNNYIVTHPNITYFSGVWLYTESYLYKRLHEIFELSEHLEHLDYFRAQKRDSYTSTLESIEQLGNYLLSIYSCNESDAKESFINLLKLNLWTNKADLSFSGGKIDKTSDSAELLKLLEPFVLCDDTDMIWDVVADLDLQSQIIDIVLDNAGYELFADLCVADFLLTKNFATQIRIHVKIYPYYVSDVTLNDFKWTLEQLKKNSSDSLQKLGKRWTKYVKTQRIIIIEDDFWITGTEYSLMGTLKPELYNKLAEAKLIMFKGDLNYRKLIADINWDPTKPFDLAVNGFGPTKLCSLRILKCDCISGIRKAIVDEIEKSDPTWLINGKYGTIQFSNFVNVLH